MRRGDRQRRPPQIDVSWRERIRYRFDNVLARGTVAALAWLGLVTFGAVLVSAALLTIFGVTFTGSENAGLLEDGWQSVLRILDPGTMSGDVGWGRRILALLITLFGILVAGTLIGIVAAGVEDRIEGMRRGRSTVIESGHLVILGGSNRIPVIIEQLVLASTRREANTIVVLTPTDPTALRAAVMAAVPDLQRTRVVYRFGDPRVPADLALTRVGKARGVIVLPEEAGDDVSVIRTVLALNAELGGVLDVPIVVEVNETTTAQRLAGACGPALHSIVTAQAVARTAAFALRQRGLSKVVTELTDFRGCDIHVTSRPELVGVRFDEIVGRFTNARPLGFARLHGHFELNPPADSTLAAGDRLVVITDTLEGIELVPTPSRLPRGGMTELTADAVEEHILVVGWSALGPELLGGWAAAAARSSTVEVAFDPRLIEPADVVVPELDIDLRLSPTPEVSSLRFDRIPTTVVVLGYASIDSAAADARTMLDVMQLRQRLAAIGTTPRLFVQTLDDDHVELTDLTGPDDLLISATLGSQFIAQLIEEPERRAVLLELYGADGASIRLVRCDVLDLVGSFTTDDIVAAAFGAGVLAIGWRYAANGSVVLNPPTGEHVALSDDDEIVIVG
jgi:Trk K+ transport system NAD-binding subunit